MKKLSVTFFCLLVAVLLFSSCRDGNNDSFYSKSCGYDCKKIPLIKPFYLGGTNGVEGLWYLTNANKDGIVVTSVNVIGSIIVSYYFDKYIVVPENQDTTWYIHIPAQEQEYKFSSEQKFYEKVSKLTDKQVEFIEIPILYKELVKKGYLDWFPEEYKSK
ncbi:MAG: hypothetical protein U9R42_03680 [Bacteroidota bacterium]|nr:hypothetical protein [Bacteroidota bacterium]